VDFGPALRRQKSVRREILPRLGAEQAVNSPGFSASFEDDGSEVAQTQGPQFSPEILSLAKRLAGLPPEAIQVLESLVAAKARSR
jgi:hypothetical protein